MANRPVLSCPVLQAGSKPGGQWFCELPGEPIKCADRVKAQGLCKGFLVSHVEIGLQVETRNLGMVLQLETHLSVTPVG